MPVLRTVVLALFTLLALPASAVAGHGLDKLLDHPAPLAPAPAQANPAFQAQPAGAWQLLGSIPTGNPHSDLDFFTQGGNTFASVGTLATGPNRGGQTIVQLTTGDAITPKIVGAAPTASCFSSPVETLSLQHDVEATPKGKAILNTFNPLVDARDAQLIVDATDGAGRCHDQGTLGVQSAPNGGLEIIDVTNPAQPATIGLTSHIGEAHTVNIDPKRPHIAYAVTSDQVTVNAQGVRSNETGTSKNLDGFEVVDLSSCMNFPADTSVEVKRTSCNPQVFRYRYPTPQIGLGHTDRANIFGCHELEVYPDDRLVCGGGTAMIAFDMSGAFDDRGTPDNYTDDKPRGTPLPCFRRDSSSARLPAPGAPSFFTQAKVVDCDNGGADGKQPLRVSEWLKIGSPSLEGVRHIGSAHHEGGTDQGQNSEFLPSEDVIFDHEAELTQSGNFVFVSDERGGGVLPPGATCGGQGQNVNTRGNGGLSFYRVDKLSTSLPANAEAAYAAYARTPDGNKAIYRAPIRTGAQATICTAHVFQQIPGQNRIFMGWYSQGTQVIDFTENPDGTISFKEVGSFIPAGANQWVSHIFKAQQNPDGTFTYFGAAGDFRVSEGGRNTIDVYRVTLPAPPTPAPGPGVLPARLRGTTVTDPQTGERVRVGRDGSGSLGAPRCVANRTITSATARTSRGRLRLGFRSQAPVTVDLFRQSAGSRIIGERLVRRFANVRRTISFNGRDRRGRRLGDGIYVARFTARGANGQKDSRRVALLRRNGRFSLLPSYSGRDGCGAIRSFKLERPVFGGSTNRALNLSFRVGAQSTASVTVRRGNRVVRTSRARSYAPGRTHRLRFTVKRATFPRGRYRVTLTVRDAAGRVTRQTLTSQRI
jgi:hypothetical protein